MHKRWFGVFLSFLVVIVIAVIASAQVEVHMASYLIRVDKQTGEETLVASDTVHPGDVVQYAITATNTAQTNAEGLALVGPVPVPTKLLPAWYQSIIGFLAGKVDAPVFCVLTQDDSDPQTILMSRNKLPEFSLDGGKTYSSPPVTYVVNGETKQATPEMFTHIRWVIAALGPGDKVEISYRVVVP